MRRLVAVLVLAALGGLGSARGSDDAARDEIVFASDRASWQLFVVDADGGGLRQLTNGLSNSTEPAWSPDGAAIAYVSDRDRASSVHLLRLDTGDVRRLTRGGGSERAPTWSPDSARVALERAGDIVVVGVDGASERRLTSGAPRDTAPAWSPDGSRIAFLRDGVPHVMGVDGFAPSRVLRDLKALRISWSPDGSRLVAHVYSETGYASALSVFAADGSGRRELRRNTLSYIEPAWSPDGRRIAFATACAVECIPNLGVLAVEGSGERTVTPSRPGARPQDPESAGDRWPSWSPDARRLVFSRNTGGTSQLYAAAADGTGLRRVTTSLAHDEWPAASPDGRRIAFLRRVHGGSALVVIDRAGSGERVVRLPAGARPEASLDWAPDGRRIAFGSRSGIWIVDAASGRTRRLTRAGLPAYDPSWSPSGRELVYARRGALGLLPYAGTLRVVGADGSRDRRISRPACIHGAPDWAADGQIVFQRLQSIYVMSAPGRPARLLAAESGSWGGPIPCPAARVSAGDGEYTHPVWSPDAAHVVIGSYSVADSSFLPVFPGSGGIFVVGRDGRGLRRVAYGGFPDWLPARRD